MYYDLDRFHGRIAVAELKLLDTYPGFAVNLPSFHGRIAVAELKPASNDHLDQIALGPVSTAV